MYTPAVNDTFATFTDLQQNLQEYLQSLNYKYTSPVVEPKTITYYCIGKSDFQCESLISCILRKKDQLWVVKKLRMQHKCPDEIHITGSDYVYNKVLEAIEKTNLKNKTNKFIDSLMRIGRIVKVLESMDCKIGYESVYNVYDRIRNERNIKYNDNNFNNLINNLSNNLSVLSDEMKDVLSLNLTLFSSVDYINLSELPLTAHACYIKELNTLNYYKNKETQQDTKDNNEDVKDINKDSIKNIKELKNEDTKLSNNSTEEFSKLSFNDILTKIKDTKNTKNNNIKNENVIKDNIIFTKSIYRTKSSPDHFTVYFHNLKYLTRPVLTIKIVDRSDGHIIFVMCYDPHDYPIVYAFTVYNKRNSNSKIDGLLECIKDLLFFDNDFVEDNKFVLDFDKDLFEIIKDVGKTIINIDENIKDNELNKSEETNLVNKKRTNKKTDIKKNDNTKKKDNNIKKDNDISLSNNLINFKLKTRELCKEVYKSEKDRSIIEKLWGICNNVLGRKGFADDKKERSRKRRKIDNNGKENINNEKENIDNLTSPFTEDITSNINNLSNVNTLDTFNNNINSNVNVSCINNINSNLIDPFIYDKIVSIIKLHTNLNENNFIVTSDCFNLHNTPEIDLEFIPNSINILPYLECVNGILISLGMIKTGEGNFSYFVRSIIEKNKAMAECYRIKNNITRNIKKEINKENNINKETIIDNKENIINKENNITIDENKNNTNDDSTKLNLKETKYTVISENDNREYNVDLETCTCSCGRFQALLIPCVHACVVAENPYDYLSVLYSKDMFDFEYKIVPVIEDVLKINDKNSRKGPGRPKRKKISKDNKDNKENKDIKEIIDKDE